MYLVINVKKTHEHFLCFCGFSCPETQKYANMMPKLTDLAYPRCFWPKVIDMVSRFQSRSWSCSELVRGAAQVEDSMASMSPDAMVVQQRRHLLSETADLSADDIQKLLEERHLC